MKRKQVLKRPPYLRPINPIKLISSDRITEIQPELITSELIGEKAYGLLCLPTSWTLPFIVVSDELLSQYRSCSENREKLLTNWTQMIISALTSIGITSNDYIIVRSSGYYEGLNERGKYYSEHGSINILSQVLDSCLTKFSSDSELKEQTIPFIIQKYIISISAKGHLSNERRFSKEQRDWLGEFEGNGNTFQINLRDWREKIPSINYIEKNLSCNLSVLISEVLKIPSTWAFDKKCRIHYEWVWDGTNIYLVQADEEHNMDGIDPTQINTKLSSPASKFIPKILENISRQHARKFNKIRNVFTYMDLDLPIIPLYILENQKIIKSLASGNVPNDLKNDISELVKGSLVIRMDIATTDQDKRQMLPRTQEERKLESALTWLKEKSSEILNMGITEDIAFIFHNFIPAISSAFAYAAPGERKVQIESLWGLPEGLYYNAHDKYTVDTLKSKIDNLKVEDTKTFEVKKKINFKNYFIMPNELGQWSTMILKPPFDWRASIQKKKWINEIAFESRRIAEKENMPLSIMWFINVPSHVCSNNIFPWHHEYYNAKTTSLAQTHRKKTPFDESLVIKTTNDIERLRIEAEKPKSLIRRVRIQPLEEKLLREKRTLRNIGELTQKIGAIILLDGGVLSHAYYQLMQTDAIVEVVQPFDNMEDKREFNKLVRDKVPMNIEDGGEVVNKIHISGELLLRSLREKLVEEAFEVLDAVDQKSILGELADVSEIMDEILININADKNQLQKVKQMKYEKAGGFKEGIVLLETRNPLPTNKSQETEDRLFNNVNLASTSDGSYTHQRLFLENKNIISKWNDRREHAAASEEVLRLEIPMTRDNWTAKTPERIIGRDFENVIQATLKGNRMGSRYQIELSLFTKKEKQLTIFDV
jgi:predicted house-cleaning noncanonical NTP pyrophosphatase (MazG superfamily)